MGPKPLRFNVRLFDYASFARFLNRALDDISNAARRSPTSLIAFAPTFILCLLSLRLRYDRVPTKPRPKYHHLLSAISSSFFAELLRP